MNMIESAIRKFAQLLAFIAGISLALMMIQTVVDVLMNNLLGRPIEGNLEVISVYHMVLVVFLPLALVELRHEHISADLFVRLLPAGVQKVIYCLGALVSATFFGILMWQTWLDALKSLSINEVVMGSIYIVVWPAKFALPIGFLAITLVFLLHAWKSLTDRHFDPTPPEPDTGNL